jgi:hypothetical protein
LANKSELLTKFSLALQGTEGLISVPNSSASGEAHSAGTFLQELTYGCKDFFQWKTVLLLWKGYYLYSCRFQNLLSDKQCNSHQTRVNLALLLA